MSCFVLPSRVKRGFLLVATAILFAVAALSCSGDGGGQPAAPNNKGGAESNGGSGAESGRYRTGRLEGGLQGYRGGAMQDLGYELPRIPIPRTWVNKGRKEGPELLRPGPSFLLALGLAA
jgi:hypothetical protein